MRKAPRLTCDLLLHAYSIGFFPMADGGTGEIRWYSPEPRAIIPIETYRPWRSLRQAVRKNLFEVHIDADFEAVMWECAAPRRGAGDSWISEEMIGAYTTLHRRGFAHSVETYHQGRLVGGVYGVAIGGAFFGESMFYRLPDASKVATHALLERLHQRGYVLLDTQFLNDHVARFGAIEIPRAEYLKRLGPAIAQPIRFR